MRLLILAIAVIGVLRGVVEVSATNVLVQVANFRFTPPSAQLNPGDFVTWTNTVFTGHDTTQSNGLWASATLGLGDTFSTAFPKDGLFPYECTIHLAKYNMVGSIAVGSATNPPPSITLTNLKLNTNRTFQFTINGNTGGKTNLVQASTALTKWTTIATSTNSGAIVIDNTGTNLSLRFYRTVQLP